MLEVTAPSEEICAELNARITASPTLTNAFRLLKDAELLFDAASHASAIALSCLAIEEIGKYLLATWPAANPQFSYDRRKLQLSKKIVVASMFLADGMWSEYKAQNIDHSEI